ncbi:MAG: TonB-dependent receptor [Ignavibacteriae bacterium]|nr:TonB-dependent receptor [Ignavibacteriota bacterium]
MRKIDKNIVIIILYLHCGLINFAQENNFVYQKISIDKFSLRNSNFFNSNIFYNNYGANRFSANPAFSVLDNFNSLSTKIILNELPINISLLGYNSLDFLPIDILTNEISESNFASDNSIKIFSKKIADSLEINVRSFLGGETGDPLIHIFTRPEISHTNKNKIIPSAAFSLANSIDKINFRISAGYFGFFSTGSINDQIMFNKSNYYFGKQNKQFLAGSEINYNISETKNIEFKFNFISYYGWDIPPFINSFIHFENYFHRAQLSFNNIIEDFTFTFKKDGQLVYFNKTEKENEIGALESDISFYANWLKSFNKDFIKISAELNNISTQNTKTNSENIFEKYLNKEINKFIANFDFNYFSNISDNFNSDLKIIYTNHYLRSSISFNSKLGFRVNANNNIFLQFSSFVNYPKEIELYGNYSKEFTSFENQMIMLSKINSNEKLTYERRINLGLKYVSDLSENFRFEIFPLIEFVKDPIEMKSNNADRDYFTNELILNGNYLNGKDKSAISIFGNLNYLVSDNTEINYEYKFTDNTEILFSPKHKSRLEIDYSLPILGFFKLNWIYQSSTRWKNFDISENDLCKIDGFSTINFYYSLELRKFYFVESLNLIFGLENLFDEDVKYLPNGNLFNRLIKFSFSAEF